MRRTRFFILILILTLIAVSGICSATQTIGGDLGYYLIESDPTGAQVSLDGNAVGITPVTVPVASTGTPGHTVVITRSGYKTWEQTIPGNPPAGQTRTISATLEPESIGGDVGYFSISSVPAGADVQFDGEFKGETPLTVQVYTTGTPTHTIRISYPGYETWERTYNQNPGPGQTISVTAGLVPTPSTGSVYVTSDPSGATATLDNGDSDKTPCSFAVVAVGTHSLTVHKDGYQPYYVSLTVNPQKTTTINAVLTPSVTTGNLRVSSSPGGASVYVDGNFYGQTPTTVGNLVPGAHTVSLRLSGYAEWTGTVTVSAGSTVSINPTLSSNPSYGSIAVTTNPSGAQVYLDGVYQGRSTIGQPFSIINVQPGSHVLQLSLPGYQDYTTTISVTAGQTTPVLVTLTPVPAQVTGNLEIVSSPSGAEVYVDNVFEGYTPLTVHNLAAGTHGVLLELGGYQDWQTSVQITKGQTTPVTATFTPTPTPSPTSAGLLPAASPGALLLVALLVLRRSR